MKVDKQHYTMQHQETDMKYENLISGTICFKCLVKDLREMAFSFSDLVPILGQCAGNNYHSNNLLPSSGGWGNSYATATESEHHVGRVNVGTWIITRKDWLEPHFYLIYLHSMKVGETLS